MWEGLRGRVEADGTATVLAVPAYMYDITFGDRVNVMRSEENALVATGVDHDALNFTFRILLKSDDDNAWRPLASELAELGCLLDVTLQHDGVLHYETGRTHLPRQN